MDSLINKKCFECDNPAEHRHHIIPRCLGGKKTVPLCKSCHKKAHSIIGDIQKGHLSRITKNSRKINKLDIEMCHKIYRMRKKGCTYREIAIVVKVSHDTIKKFCDNVGKLPNEYYNLKAMFSNMKKDNILLTKKH